MGVTILIDIRTQLSVYYFLGVTRNNARHVPTKKQMFARAKASFANIVKPSVEGYLCPICLKLIPNIDGVTIEHVPPKSLGGKKLCLTCRTCNSTAGHSIDSAMFREHGMRSFLSPSGHRTRVKVDLGGRILNAEMSQDPDAINIQILANQNNPVVEEEFKDNMTDGGEGRTINVTIWGGYRQREADVGYLKTAYLAAFSKFGYRWILTAEMEPIRQQVRSPREVIINNFRIGIKDVASDIFDGLYLMRTPVVALLVRVGTYGVFLPWPGNSSAAQISDWIDSEKRKGPSASQTYELLSRFPKEAEFQFDNVKQRAS
ncbi:MAG: HNH endonuclease [Burkholderiales bacterium]